MNLKTTAFFLCFMLLAGSSFAQWQKTSGPAETNATSVSEYFGDYYLGTNGGLFSSANQGGNWTPVTSFLDTGAGPHAITRIINFQDSLFVATYNGIFVTAGNGITWHRITSPIPDSLYGYDIYEANNEMFATAYDFDWVNYAYFTHLYHLNSAHQWAEIPNLPTDAEVTGVAALHDTLYCAIPGHGLYFSNNYGATWDSVNAVFGAINTNSVYMVQAHGGKLFAVGYNNANELLTSGDGANWQYGNITQLGGNVATSMSVFGDTVIVGAPGGVAFTHDGGANWGYSFFPNHNFNEIKFLNANEVFACDKTMGFLYSLDDSLWIPSNNGLPYATTSGLARPYNTLYAMDEVNMFSSTDQGNNWDVDTSYLWNVHDIARMGNVLMAFTTFGQSNIYSLDQGQTWNAHTGNGIGIPVLKTIVDNNNRVIYALGKNDIRRSNDYGKTWKALFYENGTIPHDTLFTSMTRISNRLFVTIVDTALELLYSDNQGDSWQRIHTGSFVYHAEAVDTTLIISSALGIETSEDMGATFTTVLPSGQLYNTYVNGTSLFNYGGPAFSNISLSTDYGATWTDISPNSDSTASVNALLMDDTYLYAATGISSVWRRPLTDLGISYTPDTTNNYTVAVNGLNKNEDGLVSVFPNPYTSQSTISVSTTKGHDIDIKVYDMMGRVVSAVAHGTYSSGTHFFKLNANLPTGIYLLITNIDGTAVTRKVIKQ